MVLAMQLLSPLTQHSFFRWELEGFNCIFSQPPLDVVDALLLLALCPRVPTSVDCIRWASLPLGFYWEWSVGEALVGDQQWGGDEKVVGVFVAQAPSSPGDCLAGSGNLY